MRELYPAIKPSFQHHIEVTPPHVLYVEECGSRSGIPIVFVHGGPGAGFHDKCRRFFDPELYRIILFDQRGCGQSKPFLCMEKNTTQALIDDMEAIREALGIEKWVLFGGSWGSTLSLLYAQKYPERVLGLILRGIFLGRQQDLKWFYQDGAKHIFPDKWQAFIEPIEPHQQHNLINAYYEILMGSDEVARMNAAKHWSMWEACCSTLDPCSQTEAYFKQPHHAMALAATEAHYFVNHCFIKEGQILKDCEKIKDIPCILVHGRYDMVCPLDNAVTLKAHLPNAELDIIRDAGHSAFEPGIQDALIHATQRLAQLLR